MVTKDSSINSILLLVSAFNSLTQRIYSDLKVLGFLVEKAIVKNDEEMISAVEKFRPDLIISPLLKIKIPEIIYKNVRCLIVHPGPVGDRGPSSLDYAIMEGKSEWGVTLLEAREEMDLGPIWGTENFKLRSNASKNEIYNDEVLNTAHKLILEVIDKINRNFIPSQISNENFEFRSVIKQNERSINFHTDSTDEILRKINAADGFPGVCCYLLGKEIYLYNATRGDLIDGKNPGDIIGANKEGALNIKTLDGSLWITHGRERGNSEKKYFKLPLKLNFPEEKFEELTSFSTINFKKISEDIGVLEFNFYNGAMATEQCKDLVRLLRQIKRTEKNLKILILSGNSVFFSNGIHLGMIENAKDPEYESWKNINAINDFVEEIILTTDFLVLSAVTGHVGAGGVPLALAGDFVLVREGKVINPHYKNLGLFGSEYWTYLLPKRVGVNKASKLTSEGEPLSADLALKMGLIDQILPGTKEDFVSNVIRFAENLLQNNYEKLLEKKKEQRLIDETLHPLRYYREHELIRMKSDIYNNQNGFREKRRGFLYKS